MLLVLYLSLGRKLVGRWITRIQVSRTILIDSHTVTVQLLRVREKLWYCRKTVFVDCVNKGLTWWLRRLYKDYPSRIFFCAIESCYELIFYWIEMVRNKLSFLFRKNKKKFWKNNNGNTILGEKLSDLAVPSFKWGIEMETQILFVLSIYWLWKRMPAMKQFANLASK